MDSLNLIFNALGTSIETVTAVSALVFSIVAFLRNKVPGDLLQGYRSDILAAVLSLGLSWQMLPGGSVLGILATGIGGFLLPWLTSQLIKGTPVEISRNGG